MSIVITPTGEYIDDQTGMAVDPQSTARGGEVMGGVNLDPRSVVREGEMARENIPSNMDMGMDSMMPKSDMTDIDKVLLLIDMGLNEQDAIEAVVREKGMGTVRPEEFSGARESAMQQQAPMQQQTPMARTPMPSSGMGALPSTPPPRPFDASGMSREQTNMLRRGIDPFAEGMVR